MRSTLLSSNSTKDSHSFGVVGGGILSVCERSWRKTQTKTQMTQGLTQPIARFQNYPIQLKLLLSQNKVSHVTIVIDFVHHSFARLQKTDLFNHNSSSNIFRNRCTWLVTVSWVGCIFTFNSCVHVIAVRILLLCLASKHSWKTNTTIF